MERLQATYDPCLADGGAMGAQMRALDWSQTSLGPVQTWPQSLRTAVSICLNSRFPILIWWGSELLMLYNDAYRPILGATKHPQALGRPGQSSWPEIWPIIGPMLEGVLSRGEATWSDDQLLVLDRNGYLEECYFTFSYSPIRDEQGQVGGVFTAVTETTAQVIHARRLATLQKVAACTVMVKTAEEAGTAAVQVLADNRADLPFALLYLLDESGEKLHLVSATGLQAGEPASPLLWEGATPAEVTSGWPFAQVLATGQAHPVTDLLTRFGPLPGEPWLASSTTALLLPIPDATLGRPTGILVAGISPRRALDEEYCTFLTLVVGQVATAVATARAHEVERKRAEALAELDRAKTTFFSNISHEFRTPLTLMLGPLDDLLQQPQALAAGMQVQLEMVYGNGLRLLKLVNTLLDFSRLQEGRMQAHYEPVDLAAYTAELASIFRATIERAGLQLHVHCPPLPRPVYIDRELWEKIVLNLLSNAFKFTLTGSITVTVAWQDDQVALRVQDTGVGIPAAEIPNLFSRFHRVRGTMARTHEGTGIGLALVQELSKLHGGDVQVTSVEGEGSTFTVTIPTRVPPTAPELRPEPAVRGVQQPAQSGVTSYIEEARRWLAQFADGPNGTPAVAEAPIDWALTTQADDNLLAINGYAGKSSGQSQSHQLPLILVADDNADMRDYLTRLLSHHYRVEAVADGAAALAAIRNRQPDLVLTDVMMPKLDGFALLQTVRQDPQVRATPVILLSARAGQESRLEGLRAGADDYLVKPFAARELLARIDAHVALQRVRQEAFVALQASEQALRQREAQLQRVMDGSNDGFWDWNVQTGIIYASPRWYEILGYTPGEFVLDRAIFSSLVHPADRAPVQQAQMALIDGTDAREDYQLIHRFYKKDGAICWVRDRGAVTQRDAQGRVLLLSGAITDITARKVAQDALRESEARFRNMADHAPTMIWVTDPTGACLFLNQLWCTYTGQTPADGLGFGWLQAVHPDDQAPAEATFRMANDNHIAFQLEYRLRRHDGLYRWCIDAAAPRFDENGAFLGYIGSVTDIDERKRMEQALRDSESRLRALTATLEQRVLERTAELERSNRELDQFAYVASHDLKAPLRGIHNLASWIADDAGPMLPDSSVTHLLKLQGRVQRMDRLLDDLLAYSRLGRREGQIESVPTKSLIEEILYLLAPPAGFTVHLAEDLPIVVTPRTPLELVFRNLISNAIKHHQQPAAGEVWVSAKDRGDAIEFCIRDNGPGIDPRHHQRIFDLFQTLRPRDEVEGSGMGLAIVKKAVEHRKGVIRVASAPGQGTTFYFTWPKTSTIDRPADKTTASCDP